MIKTIFSLKYEEKYAVNDISFDIADGEIVGYIGANGAGKSTTIKMMCGILTPTQGEVLIDGLRPYNNRERKRVLKNLGVVFGQRTQLWWDLPLGESFRILKDIYEVSEQDYLERYSFLCKVLELDKFESSPVRTLSLGQRMRADLGAALLHNPRVLFLDEPTIGMDVLVKQKMIEAIKEIRNKFNTTIILTTHDMTDIEDLCSRVIIIDEGKLLYDGSVTNIKNRFGNMRTLAIETSDELNEQELTQKFEGTEVLREQNVSAISIRVDAAQSHVNEVLEYLFASYKISDLKITETSVEDVVKKIYENREF